MIRPAHEQLPKWQCQDKVFRSKFLASVYATQIKQPVSFHFNDDILSELDWATEPPHDIDHYYKLRAESLRDQYDYIVLMYSGGADSHNILMSFVRQGLHIDEIVVNTMHKQVKNSVDLNPNNKDPKNAAAEYYLQT
jgi:hypothetical protein